MHAIGGDRFIIRSAADVLVVAGDKDEKGYLKPFNIKYPKDSIYIWKVTSKKLDSIPSSWIARV